MMTNTGSTDRPKVPLGVSLIAAFYVLGAGALLVSLVLNPTAMATAIAERHGLPSNIGVAILPLVAGLALAIAYGLFTLSRWGYWLTIAYLLYFGAVSLALGGLDFLETGDEATQVYFGNLVWSALVVTYLIMVRGRFSGRESARGPGQ